MNVSINDFLHVIKHITCDSKDDCFKKASFELSKTIEIDEKEIYNLIKGRELFGSTAIGDGFALPHAQSDKLKNLIGALFILDKPVDFNSIDGLPINIIFVFLSPSTKPSIQLKGLAHIAKIFKSHEFKKQIKKSTFEHEIRKLIKNQEKLLQ